MTLPEETGLSLSHVSELRRRSMTDHIHGQLTCLLVPAGSQMLSPVLSHLILQGQGEISIIISEVSKAQRLNSLLKIMQMINSRQGICILVFKPTLFINIMMGTQSPFPMPRCKREAVIFY